MPEISRFYGIVRMYYRDHAPAHLDAEYGSDEMLLALDTLSVIEGSLPPRALGLVVEWAALHRDELAAAWARARRLEPLGKIAPLG